MIRYQLTTRAYLAMERLDQQDRRPLKLTYGHCRGCDLRVAVWNGRVLCRSQWCGGNLLPPKAVA